MKDKNFGWNEYFKPTPKNVRRLGDAALAAAGIGGLIVPGAKWVIILGIAGKFLSNFLSDKNPKETQRARIKEVIKEDEKNGLYEK